MRTILLSLCIASLPVLAIDQIDLTPPDAIVRKASGDMLDALNSQTSPPTDKHLQELIETKALPNFDFTRITALAVGKNWRTATPAQQAMLEHEFKTLLVRTYASALTQTKLKGIDVKAIQIDPKEEQVVVHSNVKPVSGQMISIDYRMLKSEQSWKVYDVMVDGVSLVTNYRTTFTQTVQQSGIDGLIKSLVAKNAGPALK